MYALKEFRTVRTCLFLDELSSMCVPFPWLVVGVESKEICNGFSKSPRHSFKLLERRCVPSAFDQTQKIDRHTKNFGEFLLRPIRFVANLADSESELFL
jgi:hypothetical protein